MRIDVTDAAETVWRCKYFQPEFHYRKYSTMIVENQHEAQRQSDRHLQWKATERAGEGEGSGEIERVKERIFKPFASTQDAFIKLISR